MLSSMLTDWFPHAGARLLNLVGYWLVGNPLLINLNRKATIRKLRPIRNPKRILVVADLNIGDAVNLQSSFTALRDFFPYARLDYAVANCAKGIIMGNPEITRVYPVFTGRPLPNAKDCEELRRITAETKYDFIINFCAFFDEKKDFDRSSIVISHVGLARTIMHDEWRHTGTNHVVFQAYRFIHDLLDATFVPVSKKPFTGVRVTIPDSGVAKARKFLFNLESSQSDSPLIYFNPDASSIFTQVPLASQADILESLLCKLDCRILLGRGYTFPNCETDLVKALPDGLRNRIAVVPALMDLEGVAALIDFCDAYVGGDSGPLHIAASKKCSSSGNFHFRNQTAVFSIFGATPARIYGYDSKQRGFLPSNQHASSRVYTAAIPCRNMSCINKRAKTCREVRCFDSLNTNEIIGDIASNLRRNRITFVSTAVA